MNIEQYDPAMAQQQSQAPVNNEGGSKKNSSRKWWIALILIGVLILFAVTTPDKYAHKEAINTEVSSGALKLESLKSLVRGILIKVKKSDRVKKVPKHF